MQELQRKHRPSRFSKVFGQEKVVRYLQEAIDRGELPHTIMLSGPPGVGKTTLARIIASSLQCGEADFQEVNCAIIKEATETMRGISERMHIAPMFGKCRVWVFEESQSLSRANFCQQAMLRMIEEPPKHAYFLLCTTDPSKHSKAILSRCTPLTLTPLNEAAIRKLLLSISEEECIDASKELLDKIIEVSEGIPRDALVHLDKARKGKTAEEKLALVENFNIEVLSKSLAQLLMSINPKWIDVAKTIVQLEESGEEVEKVRASVLGYAKKILLTGSKQAPLAARVISAFECEMYTGRYASLALASWNVAGNR